MQPIPFVDAHQHFQDIRQNCYPWLSDPDAPAKLEGDITPIRRNYLTDEYRKDTSTVALLKSVHVQNGWNPSNPVGETRWLEALADRDGLPTAIVAHADLAAPDVESVLKAHTAYPRVRGIRQILNWHSDPKFRVAARPDLLSDPDWRRGFALLRKYHLSFDLQIYWPQMADAYRLAADFPETLILLNHFGMPVDRSKTGIADWAAALKTLAQAPNVLVKLSGLGLGHPHWMLADTGPLLLRAIETFGVERTMFGTNLPVDTLFAPASRAIATFLYVTSQCSESERMSLFRTNAELAYRI